MVGGLRAGLVHGITELCGITLDNQGGYTALVMQVQMLYEAA